MPNLKVKTNISDLILLIVEDEDHIAQVMKKTFSFIFKDVSIARNGLEAINLYNNNSYDLILSDIRMKDMDGNELIKVIRQKNRTIPVIAISAFTDDIKRNSLDFNAIVSKPISFIKLIKIIDDVLIQANKKRD